MPVDEDTGKSERSAPQRWHHARDDDTSHVGQVNSCAVGQEGAATGRGAAGSDWRVALSNVSCTRARSEGVGVGP